MDNPEAKLAEGVVAAAVRKILEEVPKDERHGAPMELLAENMAFSFTADYSNKDTGWGTYYGPLLVMKTEDGQWVESPSIQNVSGAILAYWSQRARDARHPLLRLRYSDLVWDLSKRAADVRPSHEMAQMAIDATMEYISSELFDHPVEARTKLQRALDLSLSLSDGERMQSLVDLFFRFDRSEAVEQAPGLWTLGFDSFLSHPKVELSHSTQEAIIEEMETRLARSAEHGAAGFDPFTSKALALRLARFYGKLERREDEARVLRTFAGAFRAAAEGASGLVATAWLKDVYEVLQRAGLGEDANNVVKDLREAERRSLGELGEISHEVQIPKEEIEAYFAALLAGPLAEVFPRIAIQFLPNKDKIEEQVRDLASKSPLLSMIPVSLQDYEGRAIAVVGPLHEDLAGRVVLQTAQNMDIGFPFLHEAFRRLWKEGLLSEESLVEELSKSFLFTPKRRPLLRRGLRAYIESDLLVACTILITEIEAALRQLLVATGGAIYKPSRFGGLLVRNLDEILAEPKVRDTLTDGGIAYLRVVLTDHRGWKVRNEICHGLMPPEHYDYRIADRLVHILLLLALVRVPTEQDAEGKVGDEDARPD